MYLSKYYLLKKVNYTYLRGGYDAKGNVIKPGTGISNSKGVSKIDIDNIEQLFYN